jgi:hypothetical protein
MIEPAIEVQSVAVTVAGEQINVQPLKVGQVPAFARASRGILQDLDKLNGADGIMELLADHGDDLIAAVSVATGMPVNLVQAIELDEFVGLATAVVQVNADFFTRRLAPTVQSAVATMTAVVSGSKAPRG